MMRSLLCVGSPREEDIYFPDDGYSHGHNSREFGGHGGSSGTNAAGRMRTAGRRLSLQISSKLSGRSSTDKEGSGSGGEEGKFRRKRASAMGISKRSIGHPEGFRHEGHIGLPGSSAMGGSSADINWDVEKWREQIETTMKNGASLSSSPPQTTTPATRPKGPRPESISRARPSSAGAAQPSASSSSQPNLFTGSPPTGSTSQPRASITSLASLPVGSSGAGLSRSSSVSGATGGGPNPPRRKPVPAHLPAMTEVSPFPTLLASPKNVAGIPFTQQQASNQQPQKGNQGVAEGKTEAPSEPAMPKKELVPLLGVPEGRVEGHEAHYVTKTTKARWDGAMTEIANALKDIDVRS